MERAPSGARGPTKPPLRTYSKRASSNTNNEPPTKKYRVGADGVDIHSIAGRFAQKPETPAQPVQPVDEKQLQSPIPIPAQQPRKGTILSYFKVRSPSSETNSPCAQSSVPSLPPSTPPSSPPALVPVLKKMRRLTTKPALEQKGEQDEGHDPKHEDDGDGLRSETSRQEFDSLRDVGAHSSNRKRCKEADVTDPGERGINKKQRTKQSTVQTTLSLSLTEKQFTECTDCNMLYNPYHENDIKMHKKRHAAIIKMKNTTTSIG